MTGKQTVEKNFGMNAVRWVIYSLLRLFYELFGKIFNFN